MAGGRLVAAASAIAVALVGCAASPVTHGGRHAPGIIYAAPGDGGQLAAVSCPDDSNCVAVGATNAATSQSRMVIERWNPAGWRLDQAPFLGAAAGLSAVSCTDALTCWAVGSGVHNGAAAPLVLGYANGTWSVNPAAGPGDGGVLDGVTCVVASSCWAVGSTNSPAPRALVEHFDGASWHAVSVAAATSPLRSVACAAIDDCWAVGSSGSVPVSAHYDGASWSAEPVPSPARGGGARLDSVACAGPDDCWAVGSLDATGSATLIEHLTATGWGIVPSPTTLFGGGSSLAAVTCFTGVNCWAVGSSGASTGAGRTLVEQYDGGLWTIVAGPALGLEASAALAGVTCPSDDDCWTVGSCSAPSMTQCAGSPSLVELYDTVQPDGH